MRSATMTSFSLPQHSHNLTNEPEASLIVVAEEDGKMSVLPNEDER
jgi:hypothetical protein